MIYLNLLSASLPINNQNHSVCTPTLTLHCLSNQTQHPVTGLPLLVMGTIRSPLQHQAPTATTSATTSIYVTGSTGISTAQACRRWLVLNLAVLELAQWHLIKMAPPTSVAITNSINDTGTRECLSSSSGNRVNNCTVPTQQEYQPGKPSPIMFQTPIFLG